MPLPSQRLHIEIDETPYGYEVTAKPVPPRDGPKLACGQRLGAEAAAAVVLVALHQWEAFVKDRSAHEEGT